MIGAHLSYLPDNLKFSLLRSADIFSEVSVRS